MAIIVVMARATAASVEPKRRRRDAASQPASIPLGHSNNGPTDPDSRLHALLCWTRPHTRCQFPYRAGSELIAEARLAVQHVAGPFREPAMDICLFVFGPMGQRAPWHSLRVNIDFPI